MADDGGSDISHEPRTKPLDLLPGANVRPVRNLEDAFKWVQHALEKVPPETIVKRCCDRLVTTSGAFYGVGAPEVADRCIAHGITKFLAGRPNSNASSYVAPPHFKNSWAIEISGACRAEMLEDVDGPSHVFGDICDFLPPRWRQRCGLDAGTRWPIERLCKELPRVKLLTSAYCYKCAKTCDAEATFLHRAGSPCVNHSPMGDRKMEKGDMFHLYLVWVALVRTLRFKHLVHENVTAFGKASTSAHRFERC